MNAMDATMSSNPISPSIDDPVVDFEQLMNWDLTDDWYFPSSQEPVTAFPIEFDLQNLFTAKGQPNQQGQFPLPSPQSNLKSTSSNIPSNWAPSNLRPVTNTVPAPSMVPSSEWATITSNMESRVPSLYRSSSPSIASFQNGASNIMNSNWAPSSSPPSSYRSKSPSRIPTIWAPIPTALPLSSPPSSRSKSPTRAASFQYPWDDPSQFLRPSSPPPSSRSRSPGPKSTTFPNPWDNFQQSQYPSSAASTRPSTPQLAYPYPSSELSSKNQFQNTRDFITQLESNLPYSQKSSSVDDDSSLFNPAPQPYPYPSNELASKNQFQITRESISQLESSLPSPPLPTTQSTSSQLDNNNPPPPTESHLSPGSPDVTHSTNNRRRMQNLTAQRAFRSRQKAHVAMLEREVVGLKDELKRLQGAYTALAVEFARGKEGA